jgi:hypothetical protein
LRIKATLEPGRAAVRPGDPAAATLVPVLVESGDELIRYFELDAFRLESIINEARRGRVGRWSATTSRCWR